MSNPFSTTVRPIGFCNVTKICSDCGHEQYGNYYNHYEKCSKCGGLVIDKSSSNIADEMLKAIKKHQKYLKAVSELPEVKENDEYQICIDCNIKIKSDRYAYHFCPVCNHVMIEPNDGEKIKRIIKLKQKTKEAKLN